MSVERSGTDVTLHVGTESHDLSRAGVRELKDQLSAALSAPLEFAHTAGRHREDGSYVVERRGVESSGHRKVFDSFERLERLYAALPPEFTAESVATAGVTGSRRHMLVWHFVEHPAFDCELSSRQPLTVTKRGDLDLK